MISVLAMDSGWKTMLKVHQRRWMESGHVGLNGLVAQWSAVPEESVSADANVIIQLLKMVANVAKVEALRCSAATELDAQNEEDDSTCYIDPMEWRTLLLVDFVDYVEED